MKQENNIKNDLLNLFSEDKEFLPFRLFNESIKNIIKEKEIPTSKTEQWKNTSLDAIFKHKFELGKKINVPNQFVDTFSFYGSEADRLVFVNGFFIEEKSQISQNKDEIYIGSLRNALQTHKEIIAENYCKTGLCKHNFFTAINSEYSQNGAFIYIPDNVVLENPIHIVNFIHGDNKKVFSQTRNLIVAGKNSNAKIISSYHSLSEDFTLNNVATEIITKEHSNLQFYIFEGEGNSANLINNTFVNQHEGSTFISNTSTMCGNLVRNEIHIDYKGEHCETDLQGIYLPDKEQHFDNFINIKHSKPNCKSNQIYKGIIDNKAKAVFTGKVYVARDAQKTDAVQSNKNLLLTDSAKVFSRPQLEIYADDVSCAHGSTTGQLDQEAIFYMKTRGISERKAKTLLMSAFIGDVLDKIEISAYKDYVKYLLNRRLKGQKVEGLCSLQICPSC
ncbi:MAG: Fe-S cluster assembly protein SufD [Chlorobi bacterium]|nr:Fe-S cluster assembly protein SufD [Chlorobiota bacterium]